MRKCSAAARYVLQDVHICTFGPFGPRRKHQNPWGPKRRDRLPFEGRASVRGRRLDVQPSMSATLTPRILVLPEVIARFVRRITLRAGKALWWSCNLLAYFDFLVAAMPSRVHSKRCRRLRRETPVHRPQMRRRGVPEGQFGPWSNPTNKPCDAPWLAATLLRPPCTYLPSRGIGSDWY